MKSGRERNLRDTRTPGLAAGVDGLITGGYLTLLPEAVQCSIDRLQVKRVRIEFPPSQSRYS